MTTSLLGTFMGGDTGPWQIKRTSVVIAPALPAQMISQPAVLPGETAQLRKAWCAVVSFQQPPLPGFNIAVVG